MVDNRIKFIREQLGDISQQKLADMLEIPVHRIKNIESGKVKISVELALLMEQKLNYSFKWLLTGEGEPSLKNDTIHELKKTDIRYFNPALLEEIIEGVEESLQSMELELEPRKKARLVTILYEHFIVEDQKVKRGTVEKYLRLVS